MELDSLRREIDNLDQEILRLVNRRLKLARKIGEQKQKEGLTTLNNARENQVLQNLDRLNQGPLTQSGLHLIFKEIMAAARELQNPHRIAFLGPEASHTHLAALGHFGGGTIMISQNSVAEVFQAVEKGSCHYGLVPVENSIEGAVNHTLDLFFGSNLKICAEHYQTIAHDLLAKSNQPLERIGTVYSHAQAFAQCRQWLRRHLPGAVLIECSSTAEAARRAAAQGGSSAAIAGAAAAELYNLQVVAAKIEDLSGNTTRFLVLGREDSPPSGHDKTSILFVTPHLPGALYQVLTPMAEYGVNMVKLESRPTRNEKWSYFFIADFEGHRRDEKIAAMLESTREICLFMKILGSYPRFPGIV
ncbi:MAG: prephenate dehydratase [Deltaproteobacteria bacterium]|nr:prephenate dehydratase [Deltaproteobacteria bacterium]